jgi:hypothetical protein
MPDVPGGTWDVGIVLEFDLLVEVPERFGLKRVIELAFSEAVESVAKLVEDPKILFLRRHGRSIPRRRACGGKIIRGGPGTPRTQRGRLSVLTGPGESV